MEKWKFMVFIETKLGSNYSYRYDEDLKCLYLKRLTSTRYPCHYGRLVHLDENKKVVYQKEDKEDVFLICNREIPEGMGIPDANLVKLGSFICYDERKKQRDNKSVYALKGEAEHFPDYRVATELDTIRSYLICLRGSFKIEKFKCENVSKKVEKLLDSMDWETHKCWPAEFKDTFEEGYTH